MKEIEEEEDAADIENYNIENYKVNEIIDNMSKNEDDKQKQ